MASNKRIFIAFAVEDKFARDNLVYQAKRQRTAPFDFTDLSVKEPWDEKWKTNCRTHLTRHFLFGLSSRRDCTPGFLLSGQSRVVFHPGSSPVVSARPDCRSPRASTPKLPLLEAISSTSLPPLPLLDRFLCCYRFGYGLMRKSPFAFFRGAAAPLMGAPRNTRATASARRKGSASKNVLAG
jgi:hypothetical protein